jgi:hypothetical protein
MAQKSVPAPLVATTPRRPSAFVTSCPHRLRSACLRGGGEVGFEVGAKLSCGGDAERLGALEVKQRGSGRGLLVASEGV